MRKKRQTRDRGAEAIRRAEKSIADAGWTIIRSRGLPYITTAKVAVEAPRFVAVKRVPEREDDSVTMLFESDYTIEGLAVLVTRREREEGRKA